MNKSNKIIPFLFLTIVTILYIMADTLNSIWPRVIISVMTYTMYVWIRFTRWWNIVFDVLIVGLILGYILLFDIISNDMRFNLFILFAIVSGLYLLVIAIAKIMGYPLTKEDNQNGYKRDYAQKSTFDEKERTNRVENLGNKNYIISASDPQYQDMKNNRDKSDR